MKWVSTAEWDRVELCCFCGLRTDGDTWWLVLSRVCARRRAKGGLFRPVGQEQPLRHRHGMHAAVWEVGGGGWGRAAGRPAGIAAAAGDPGGSCQRGGKGAVGRGAGTAGRWANGPRGAVAAADAVDGQRGVGPGKGGEDTPPHRAHGAPPRGSSRGHTPWSPWKGCVNRTSDHN